MQNQNARREQTQHAVNKNCHSKFNLESHLILGSKARSRIKVRDVTGLLNNGGFTLIELLVVVLIIGILAAVAVPQYQKAVLKSRYGSIKHLVVALANAQEIYYLANGEYASSYDQLDVDLPGQWALSTETLSLNRPQYTFDWGTCTLRPTQMACAITTPGVISYKIYYQKIGTTSAGVRRCIAESRDLDSIENKFCKQETGQESPSHTGSTYLEWNYKN